MPERISFARRLGDLARLHPEETAIVLALRDGSESSLSWADLDCWTTRFAHRLLAWGAGAGTVVVIGLPNGLEHYVAVLAAWRCGACTLPLSPRMPDRELAEVLNLLDRSVVVMDRAVAALRPRDVSEARYDAGLSGAPLPDVIAHPGKAIGSGGSTGRPKIIVDPSPWARTPGTVEDVASIGFRSGQTQLVAGPLYHNAPFTWSHLGLFEDHQLIVMERFDAEQAVALVERFRCTFTFLAPTMMMRIARLAGIRERDLTSLKLLHSAAVCPEWLKRVWIDLIGPGSVIEAYGSTEAVGHTTIDGHEWLQHPGSVGRAQSGELRILDADLREVGPSEIGEIFFRPACHPQPTYLYVGAPPARSTADGFVSVGDLGWVDSQGWLTIADRRTDLIVSGGANVFPAEVEAALTEHPGVVDAAVIGLPDSEWGRCVHAVVEPDGAASHAPTAEELKAWLRDRLSPYKIPKSFEIGASIPRDASGKLRRAALVDERSTPPTATLGC